MVINTNPFRSIEVYVHIEMPQKTQNRVFIKKVKNLSYIAFSL
ncbi:hypothetical protein VCRA2120E57_70121 [Vibrio crassostreae]|nr:hypothetical protein VCRA2120E57_70121 [Vibrio crassostreae]